MKEIDVFKLGRALNFEIHGAELSEETNSLMIIDETADFITGFNSNKVILYNYKKDINIKINCVASHLKKYITIKSKGKDKIIFANINADKSPNIIDINHMVEDCIKLKFIKNKKKIKMLYK